MKLLIVSNRLPFSVQINEEGMSFKKSPGGLVSGLASYLTSDQVAQRDFVWIGWPGQSIPEEWQQQLIERSNKEFQSYPVFLTEDEMENFYHGFCNSTIWPLFHYFPSYSRFEPEHWQQYQQVNRIFCDAVLKIAEPDDLIWIHDYHLMLLPEMLRERLPEASIGFFLHIPFPSFEVFRMLPKTWRAGILVGMLGADLIGFHTHHFTQYFLRCVLRILGYEHASGQITIGNRVAVADTFPMGIEFNKFQDVAKQESVVQEYSELRQSVGNRKVIISVDRLDYSKGIINRLEGYEIFLQRNPEWHDQVVLLLVVVPSRIGVEHYQLMKQQIDEMVGKINGKFGTISWTPVVYQYRSVDFEPLVALYRASDIALITPLRDGMNLISKEYVASRVDQTGVLILSEMAGASSELGEAIIINPNNREEVAESLIEALRMPDYEQKRRMKMMQNRLENYDVIHWAGEFLKRLNLAKQIQYEIASRVLNRDRRQEFMINYQQAANRLFLQDYDGTLVAYAPTPEGAKPSANVLNILRRLADNPKNDLVIISGRDKNTLDEWFDQIPAGLVAEHGAWIREKDQEWRHIFPQTSVAWKNQIRQILEVYVDRLPGSFIEEKEFTIVWHFRKADLEFSSVLTKELVDHLQIFAASMNIQIILGNKNVEIRNAGIHKGAAAAFWMGNKSYDFIAALGDDTTDEDLFRSLPDFAYSIKVGSGKSAAKYNLLYPSDALQLLNELALM